MPIAAALTGSVLISFSAIWFALADVEPTTGAFFRAGYALPVVFVLWWRKRHLDHRSTRARLLALGSGVLLAVDFISWHLSIDYIGTGLGTLLANTQVVLVALLAWLLHGERPSRVVVGAIPVILVGAALVSGLGDQQSYGANPVWGTVMGLTSAVFYTGFLLGYRRSNKRRAPAAGSLLDATFGAWVTTFALGPIVGGLDLAPSWPGHGWLGVLALGSQVFGWLAIGYSLPRLPAAETAVLILLQPVLTMIWGALIFSERPSPIQLAGAALILSGVGVVATVTGRRSLRAEVPV